ncbi:hypothetical protein LTS10_010761 [Elasticomyces elasticus]|nr:hypothetical protein LTS10_010761 [Elasticomyces elasticus]
MAPPLQPLKLYSHLGGPNPLKVAIILTELGVPFHQDIVDMSKLKQEPYISANPNGRVPALDDPNTGVVTWESGACIEYLLENYDKEHKLQYTSSPEKWDQAAWKYFQVSGQGPYFGQAVWFKVYHPEQNLTSAIDRYNGEIKRVLGVIDAHLAKTGKLYLVGDKVSFVDFMFVPWNHIAPFCLGEGSEAELEKSLPLMWAWRQRLEARESVKAAYAEIERLKAEQGAGSH